MHEDVGRPLGDKSLKKRLAPSILATRRHLSPSGRLLDLFLDSLDDRVLPLLSLGRSGMFVPATVLRLLRALLALPDRPDKLLLLLLVHAERADDLRDAVDREEERWPLPRGR